MYNLDLDRVSAGNLAILAQCVNHRVGIVNVRGDLSPMLRSVRCRELEMADMRLSTAHTESLLATMVSGVEVVLLGAGVTGHGDSGSVRWPGRLPDIGRNLTIFKRGRIPEL